MSTPPPRITATKSLRGKGLWHGDLLKMVNKPASPSASNLICPWIKKKQKRCTCMLTHSSSREKIVVMKETEIDGKREVCVCGGEKMCELRHLLWDHNDCSVFPPRSDRAHSFFFTAESDRLKAEHLFLSPSLLSSTFSFLSPLSFSICLVRLVNPGLKCGAVTGAWCLNAADTARVADRKKKKSDASCQLADAPRWCSVLSIPQKNRCLRGCKPAIMWATGGVLAAVRSLMQTRRHCTNLLSF